MLYLQGFLISMINEELYMLKNISNAREKEGNYEIYIKKE